MKITMFGGQEPPSWTRETDQMIAFYTKPAEPYRIDRLDFQELTPEQTQVIEQQLANENWWTFSNKTTNVMGWHHETPTTLYFGWSSIRVAAGKNQAGVLFIHIEEYFLGVWRTLKPNAYNLIVSNLCRIICDESYNPVCSDFSIENVLSDLLSPPWDLTRYYKDSGQCIKLTTELKIPEPTEFQQWSSSAIDDGFENFTAWIKNRLRRVGVLFPEFCLFWTGLKVGVDSAKTKISKKTAANKLNFFLASFNTDPQWQDNPWLWLCLNLEDVDQQGSLTVDRAQNYAHSAINTKNLIYLFHEDDGHLNQEGLQHLGDTASAWMRARPLSQVRRLFRVVNPQSNYLRNHRPGWSVIQILSWANLPVPPARRFIPTAGSPCFLFAALSTIPEWMASKAPWMNYNIEAIIPKLPAKGRLIEAKRLNNQHPEALPAIRQAVLTTLGCYQREINTLIHTFKQLCNTDLAPFVDWSKIMQTIHEESLDKDILDAEWRAWKHAMTLAEVEDETNIIKLLEQTYVYRYQKGRFFSQIPAFLSREPDWEGWQDKQGRNLLNWLALVIQMQKELEPTFTLDSDTVWWFVHHMPNLLTHQYDNRQTLHALPIDETLKTEIQRFLLQKLAKETEQEDIQLVRF